jgi:hypothetical protein
LFLVVGFTNEPHVYSPINARGGRKRNAVLRVGIADEVITLILQALATQNQVIVCPYYNSSIHLRFLIIFFKGYSKTLLTLRIFFFFLRTSREQQIQREISG